MWPLLLIGGVLYLLAKKGGEAQAFIVDEAGNVVAAAQDVVAQVQDTAAQAAGSLEMAMGQLPAAALPYADLCHRVGQDTGWDPLILLAIGWRESLWGTSKFLDVPGPTGTGDFAVRDPADAPHEHVQQVGGLYGHWRNPRGLAPPFAVPDDSRGWGRGLMQIDFDRAMTVDWADPETSVRTAAQILTEKKRSLAGVAGLSGADLTRAAVAAYNHGQRVVRDNFNSGGIEAVDQDSHGNDNGYSADVLAHADQWRSA